MGGRRAEGYKLMDDENGTDVMRGFLTLAFENNSVAHRAMRITASSLHLSDDHA